MTIIPSGLFDYSTLPADVATEARAVAVRVKERHERQIASIIETGRDLLGVKNKLEHGQFSRWLDAEFGMTDRTARNYMSAADAFAGKTETISVLPPATVYALSASSTPEPVRVTVIRQIEAGERVDPVAVRVMIKEAKEAEKITAKVAKMKPAQQRAHRRKERDREAEQAEWQAKRDAEKRAAIDAGAMIEKALGDDLPAFLAKLREASIYEFRAYLLG